MPRYRSATPQEKHKVKQFAAGRVVRNSSYGKLARLRSTESVTGLLDHSAEGGASGERPKFRRTKSSGDVLKHNKSSGKLNTIGTNTRNKSVPNLASRLGLTMTSSGRPAALRTTSLRGTRHKVVIDMVVNDSEDDSEDAEEVEEFSEEEGESPIKKEGKEMGEEEEIPLPKHSEETNMEEDSPKKTGSALKLVEVTTKALDDPAEEIPTVSRKEVVSAKAETPVKNAETIEEASSKTESHVVKIATSTEVKVSGTSPVQLSSSEPVKTPATQAVSPKEEKIPAVETPEMKTPVEAPKVLEKSEQSEKSERSERSETTSTRSIRVYSPAGDEAIREVPVASAVSATGNGSFQVARSATADSVKETTVERRMTTESGNGSVTKVKTPVLTSVKKNSPARTPHKTLPEMLLGKAAPSPPVTVRPPTVRQLPPVSARMPTYNSNFLLSQSTGQERQVSRNDTSYVDDRSTSAMSKDGSSQSLIFRQSHVNLPDRARVESSSTGDSSKKPAEAATKPAAKPASAKKSPTHHFDEKKMGEKLLAELRRRLPHEGDVMSRTEQRLLMEKQSMEQEKQEAYRKGPFRSMQSRVESERFSKEYERVRRYSSPIYRILKREAQVKGIDVKKGRAEKDKAPKAQSLPQEQPLRPAAVRTTSFFDLKPGQTRKKTTEDLVKEMWIKGTAQFKTGDLRENPRRRTSLGQQRRYSRSPPQMMRSYMRTPTHPQPAYTAMPPHLQPTTRAQQNRRRESSNLVNLE